MAEVTLQCKLARNYTMLNIPEAVAYLLIKVLPDSTIDFGSLPVNIGLIIDVSNSMGGKKLKNAKAAAKHIVDALKPDDTISITIFSDDARAIVPSTKAVDKYTIKSKIDKISTISGTRMYHGLEVGCREIRNKQTPASISRAIVLTHGETEGEEHCMTIAKHESENNLALTAFGIGDKYNEVFLKDISKATLGSFFHLQTPEQIGVEFSRELQSISAAVISNMRLRISMVKGVVLEELHRIYPNAVRLTPEHQDDGRTALFSAGNLRKDEQTVFGAQLKLPARSAGKVRIAQVSISYDIPSLDIMDRTDARDVVLEYTADRDLCGKRPDQEVLRYFNQLPVEGMIDDAIRKTKEGDVSGATQLLQQAQMFTQRIGNTQLTRRIEDAMEELKDTGEISTGLVKTVRAESGHTVTIEDEDIVEN